MMEPSHDPVARMPSLVSGENLTAETQSLCWSSSTVNLHSPTVFQILMFFALSPEAICLLSAENEQERRSLALPWSMKVWLQVPFAMSHSLRVPSHEHERAYLESYEMARSSTKCE